MNELAISLALLGVEPEDHFLYLAPDSDRRQGPETLEDYLNGQRRFLPMMASGVPRMINRDQILWVGYERSAESFETDVTVIETLTILELTDGSRIEGIVPVDRPREQSRMSDVLNEDREIFLRIDDGARTYYVNKTFIRLVVPR